MDLVALLEQAASQLPAGEHSVGLNAIVRHVKAAIRHLERDQITDPDTCTDAIYRMNQAYEGSLKEAYRVLASKDPSGLSPFQIENYLESNRVVRPRVLTQLTRYRQDYRNPSTHDYKLDFDDDEALLAIVSVCGFAKLLINQISSKLASNAAVARVANLSSTVEGDGSSVLERIARICFAYTIEGADVAWFEFERGVSESLTAAGFEAQLFANEQGLDPDSLWDVEIKADKGVFAIDVKVGSVGESDGRIAELNKYPDYVTSFGVAGLVVIVRTKYHTDYSLFRVDSMAGNLFVICDNEAQQMEQLGKDLGRLSKLA
ncbi:hypothetical protein [Sphingomonas aerolata]|jgi:hypothetical protein|uniref:hypothetical protein n=1 Tax=Sphingomonas aerolata TaxID=185951 RepID=UPI002FE17ABF